jgi:DNA-binding MarR family transcriptional regulator
MNKSSPDKATLIEALGRTVVRWQDATQKHDEAVGEIYGLGATERLCLSFLWLGPRTASAIAREIRLTPAAVTSLIDRLEARGFVRRRADPNDRRKVMVEAAEAAQRATLEAYAPLGEAGATLLESYSVAELEIVQAVLTESMALQEKFTAELLAKHGKK